MKTLRKLAFVAGLTFFAGSVFAIQPSVPSSDASVMANKLAAGIQLVAGEKKDEIACRIMHWPSTRRPKYPRHFDGAKCNGDTLPDIEISIEGKLPRDNYPPECLSRHKRSTKHKGGVDSCPSW